MATPKLKEVTGVILVGGKSRRMGRDKAFLTWEGRPLFEKVLTLFQENFDRVVLVGDRPERFATYPVEVIPDLYPGSALGGLYTGLVQARTEYIFVAPCDMPFPNGPLLRHLCALRNGHDTVVPKGTDIPEPLYALYAKTSLPAMKRLLDDGNFRIYDIYPELRTRYVSGEELASFLVPGANLSSMNTPEEHQALKEELPR